MFEGFKTDQVDVGEASIYLRHGGDGPPVLLLHGHPRTSATWHRVAPQLVQRGFTVVCPGTAATRRDTGMRPRLWTGPVFSLDARPCRADAGPKAGEMPIAIAAREAARDAVGASGKVEREEVGRAAAPSDLLKQR